MLNARVYLTPWLVTILLFIGGVSARSQGADFCHECEGITIWLPHTVLINFGKCPLKVTVRQITCTYDNECTYLYLEKIESVLECCDLLEWTSTAELVNDVTRHILTDLETSRKFFIADNDDCARVYRKRCWTRSINSAVPCSETECCYVKRIGAAPNYGVEFEAMGNPECDTPGCDYVCP